MPSIVEVIAKFINEASPGLKQLGGDVGNVGKEAEKTDKSTQSLAGNVQGLLGQFGMTLSVVGALGSAFTFLKGTVDAYGESELVAAQVNAVLQSTQHIAGVTAEEIDNLANSLSRMSGVDDEAIKRGEALLLTFTKVGKDVFPAATEAALNMSMAMGTDLQASIMQVGKALNDPIQGATALRRVGVQLTDQQEEQIKKFMAVNDVASAQGVILQELQTEFGGVAQMMGDTTVGSTNKLKVAWGNLMETMGEDNAGIWRSITDGLTGLVNNLNEGAEAVNTFQDLEAKGTELARLYGGETAVVSRQIDDYSKNIMSLGYEYARAEQYGLAWSNMLASQTETTYTANDALSEYVPNYSQLLDLSTGIANETERYNEKQQELMDKQAAIKMQIDELIAMGYSPLSQKVRDLQTDYDALGVKYDENATKHREAMGRIQYDLLLTKLSVDGLTAEEFEMMQQAGVMFGVFDEGSAEAARQMDQVTQAVSEGKIKVQDMRQALEMMKKGYTIEVVINTLVNAAAGRYDPTEVAPSQKGKGGKKGYAEGGIASGPSSGYWELLHGTEAVIPLQGGSIPVQFNGSNPMGGGGGAPVIVNVTIASPINLMTEQEAQTVLLPMVVEAVKQAQAEARL